MKKILLSVLALLALAGSGTAQNLPSYVPANGLVGWWPFNGNANDESGNNNNGTNSNVNQVQDRFGENGKAFRFNGNNSYLFFGQLNQLSTSISPIITFSYWVKDNPGNGTDVFDLRSTNNSNIGHWINYSSSGNLGMINYNSPASSGQVWAGSQSIPDLIWTHIVTEINYINNTAKFYQNGALVQTTIITPTPLGVLTNPKFNIGSRFDIFNSRCCYFNGDLDDFAIYNRALTQQEITGLYQGANTTANCPTFPASLTQGLVGYWPFCGNALDESGNGNHGTVNSGVTLTADRFGNVASAYNFNNGGITTNLSGPKGRAARTIAFWYNFNSLNTTQDEWFLVGYGYNGCGGGFGCNSSGSSENDMGIDVTSSVAMYNTNSGSGSWQHYVATYDSLFGNNVSHIKIYHNGVLQTDPNIISGINCIINTGNTTKLAFGSNSNPVNNYQGKLDDIAIWNRVLSPQEIQQVYNQGICQTSITVTDTLLIHTGLTSYNPVAYGNTLKVWPNPGNTAITLDAGNLSSMQGWKYKVANTLGQTVVNETAINQQQTNISLSTWGGNGIYYLHLINPQGHAIEIKKIVLAP